MANFSNQEKYDMLKCFMNSEENTNLASELYFNRYPERMQPDKKIFKRLQQNLINCGTFSKSRPKRYAKENREHAENAVIQRVRDNPNISSREIEHTIRVPRTTTLRFFLNKFKPYKIPLTHYLYPNDYQRRLYFCRWFLQKCIEIPGFKRNVIWTDEAYISSAGIFNRHNKHHWAQENPHITAQVNRQGRFGFSIWCGLMGNRIIGPHFFEENLNSNRFIHILREELEPFVDNLPLAQNRRIYFQLDGAPSHTSRDTVIYLNTHFTEQWIGNNGPVLWPARSPDLTPADFWLWGYLKNIIYQQQIHNIQQLREITLAAFRTITPLMVGNVTNAVEQRCQKCIAAGGRQFENLL